MHIDYLLIIKFTSQNIHDRFEEIALPILRTSPLPAAIVFRERRICTFFRVLRPQLQ